jgi:2',3'-cyclic-nucleotide 2'-phosphodiesterase (5'-nucleotidase family)
MASPRIHILCILALFTATVLACSSEKKSAPPAITIVHTNDLLGEIRSCGCAYKDLGGLGRRATFVRSVRDTAGDVLVVDGGDLFSSELNYGREKADLTLRSIELMGYDGVVPGERDLGFGVDFLVERVHSLKLPVVAANLRDTRGDSLIFAPSREVTLPSGVRVGLIGVLSPRLPIPPQSPEVRVTDPLSAVKEQVDVLRPRVDLVVLLAHMVRGEVRRIANELPGIDLIVLGHDPRPMRKLHRIGNAYVLQVGEEGRFAGVAYAVLGTDPRVSYVLTDVTSMSRAYSDDEAIAKLFRSYDLNIAAKEKSNIPAGVSEMRAGLERPFVGADACKACHEDIHDQWAGTKHSHAFEILVNEGREYDRDCTPCHTTGFYKRGGFENLEATPELIHVQCEACHGNGYEHSNDPDIAPATDARGVCVSCHNAEQSPDFDFGTWWPRIAHDGDGAGPEAGSR